MAKFKTPPAAKPMSEHQKTCRVLWADPKGRLSVVEDPDGHLFVVCDSKLKNEDTTKLVAGQLLAVKSSRTADVPGYRVASNVTPLPFNGKVTWVEKTAVRGEIDDAITFHIEATNGRLRPEWKGKWVEYALTGWNKKEASRVELKRGH